MPPEADRLPSYEDTRLDGGAYVLRTWRYSDASEIADAYQDDDEIPRRTGFPFKMTAAQASEYITTRREGWRTAASAAFGIFDPHDRLLGSVSLLGIDWDTREAEIAYWLARHARGHGVALQAVERLVQWAAELALTRLTATVEASNEASCRVLDRAGFRKEGLARANRRLHDRWIDEYLYTRTL